MKSDAYLNAGVPFIRIENIKNGFSISTDNLIYISEFDNSRLKSSQLFEDDLILSKVGNTIGYYARVDSNIKNCNISENNIGIKLNSYNRDVKHYIMTFLNSKYGNILTLRRISGNAQPKLNVFDISEIPIPQFNEEFYKKISDKIIKADELKQHSKSLYSQAEDLLLNELGLKEWQPKNTLHTTKKFSDFAQSGRLDAEYYQPKYDDLFEKLSCLNCKRLGKIVSIKKSFDPGSDAYQETGIPFIRVSDISKDGIEKTELHLSPIDFDIPELKPKKDTILFSKDGSIGIAYKVQSDLNVFTSGALLHLVTTDSSILPDYLTLVLNSVVVKLQAERDSNGAIIQHWKPSDIENVIIPILPEQIQKKIASLIQQSFECRAQSKQLLEDAKRMVEAEIEKN